jgi:tetratricopeptide (TPR) repeat protein
MLAAALVLLLCGCRAQETPLSRVEAAARSNPNPPAAFIELGNAYAGASRYNDAFVAHSAAIRLDPHSFDAACALTTDLLNLGSPRDAILWARRAISLRPKSLRAHELAGQCLLAAETPDAAIEELRKAVAIDPSSFIARLNLTSAYAMKGDIRAALSQSQEVLRLRPKDVTAHFAAADIQERAGNLAAAEAEFARAVGLDPNSADSKLRLAMVLIREHKDFPSARSLAQQADRIDPGDGTPAALAAWALYLNGDRLDGTVELQSAAMAHPYTAFVWLRLADAFRGIGQDKRAQQALQRASVLSPRAEIAQR